MKIGEFAQCTDVRIGTARYYERKGLLPQPARHASGYRSYGSPYISRLRFMRHANALGFNLEEIRELLALFDRCKNDTSGLQATATQELTKFADVERIRDGLQAWIAFSPEHGALDWCPTLNALDEDRA